MPDDFASPYPRTVPCVPRRPAVPVADGPREADEQHCCSPAAAHERRAAFGLADELQQAAAARDLLNRLADAGKIRLLLVEHDMPGGPDMLGLIRLVPRTVYDEEVLP